VHSIGKVDNFPTQGAFQTAPANYTIGRAFSFFFIFAHGHRCTYHPTCNFLNNSSRTISVKFAKNSLVIGWLVFISRGEGVLPGDIIMILNIRRKKRKRMERIQTQEIFVLARLFSILVARARRSRHFLFHILFLHI
jgi:hypothetical protein